jgi:hypothetical protein
VSFLTPIPMLIAAGLAVPALLSLYFLKLRRRPVRVSSTMLWEDAARDLEVNAPLRWIRNSWLLWLHLLILALLLMALGRPTIDTAGARPDRVVLLIDRSASMNATGATSATGVRGVSRLDLAKRRAIELAEEATDRGVQVAVLAFDSRPVLVGPPSTSRAELRQLIDAIEPTDRPGDPQAAFDLAQTLTARAPDESAADTPTTVVLLSDGGDTPGRSFTLAGASFRFERIAENPAAPNDPGAPSNSSVPDNLVAPDNLGVVALNARRDRDDPALVRLFFRVLNTGPKEIAVPVSIDSEDENLRRFAVRVPPAELSPAGRWTPGELARTLELRLNRAQTITLRLDRPDALAADNAAGLSVPRPEAPSILLVSEGDEAGSPRPSPILTDLLTALEPRVLRSVSLETYQRWADNPGDADVIVFDRVSLPAAARRPSITFGVVPGFLASGAQPASPPPAFPPPALDTPTRAVSWDRTHPALRDVALESLVVGHRVALPESTVAGVERLDVLVSGQAGPLVLACRAQGVDHLVLAFSPRDSNWPMQIGFPIFMAQAIESLAPIGRGAPGRVFTTADPVRLRASAGETSVRLDGPESLSAPVIGGVANLGVPRLAGLYSVAGAPTVELPVSLLSPGESGLGTADRVAMAGRSVAASAEPDLGPTEIWRWLVLAALALLAVDWLVFGLKMRVGETPQTKPGTIGMGDQA